MFKNFNLLLILLTLLKELNCLKLNYFCKNEKAEKCWGMHRIQCQANFCATNVKECDKFNLFSKTAHKNIVMISDRFKMISKQNFENFKIKISKCVKLDQIIGKVCLNSLDCFQTTNLVLNGIIIRKSKTKLVCKCEAKFEYQCNKNYCTNDLASCELIKELKHTKLNEINNCGNSLNHTILKSKMSRKRF
jgi:hypothetical protein